MKDSAFVKACKEIGGTIKETYHVYPLESPDICIVDSDEKFLKMIKDKTWSEGEVKLAEHLPDDDHLYLSYIRFHSPQHPILRFHFAHRAEPKGWRKFAFETTVYDDKDIKIQDWL